MRPERCKGTRDLSPDEMRRFRLIESTFRDCCLKWGFGEVRTPTLEYLHLFTSAGTLTPSQLGKVYSFLDWDGWSGERVVLRPDGTIPIARYYIDTVTKNELAKFFYVTNVFSFEETGKETREKWQCGAELIGAGSPMADVQLVTLSVDVLKKLELTDIEVRLSHAGLIKALLAHFRLSSDEQTRIFDEILDGDVAALARLESENPELSRTLTSLLKLKGKSSGFLKNIKSLFDGGSPELTAALNNFIDITKLLDTVNCPYRIDMTAGRGFEYYTGAIFQIFACDERVGGGGRYDALIPLMGGQDAPASGFALYVDRLMELVTPEIIGESPKRILIKTDSAKTDVVKEALVMADALRQAGYVAELAINGHESAEAGWTLTVQDKTPLLVLTERSTRKKLKADNAAGVLTFLRRQGGD